MSAFINQKIRTILNTTHRKVNTGEFSNESNLHPVDSKLWLNERKDEVSFRDLVQYFLVKKNNEIKRLKKENKQLEEYINFKTEMISDVPNRKENVIVGDGRGDELVFTLILLLEEIHKLVDNTEPISGSIEERFNHTKKIVDKIKAIKTCNGELEEYNFELSEKKLKVIKVENCDLKERLVQLQNNYNTLLSKTKAAYIENQHLRAKIEKLNQCEKENEKYKRNENQRNIFMADLKNRVKQLEDNMQQLIFSSKHFTKTDN